jgi:hypothetical protein
VGAVYCAVVSLGALLTGSQVRGLLYGAAAIAAFLLIYRNLRADPTLRTGVDTAARAELGLDR